MNYHTDLICIIPSIISDVTSFADLFDDFYIGFNKDEDLARGFIVSAGGVTVVPKGAIL